MGILFTSTLLLAGWWLARRPLTPQTRRRLLSVWCGCIALFMALIILFFSLGALLQPPNTPMVQQLGRAWALLILGLGSLGVVLIPLAIQEIVGWLQTPPQQSPLLHGIKDSYLMLVGGLLIIGISIVIRPLATPQSLSTMPYGGICLGVGVSLVGVSDWLESAHPQLATLILRLAVFVCLPGMIVFAGLALIEKYF
ncbi:MAG TPA: hypothetical protein VFS21_02970 [Roseiflexaceae bacterium]|nr:hypothetical protein [Roseiflexaceae bacterium]